jgi:hypothetical protein
MIFMDMHLHLLANKLETSCLQLSSSQPMEQLWWDFRRWKLRCLRRQWLVTAHCAQDSAPAFSLSTKMGDAVEMVDICMIPFIAGPLLWTRLKCCWLHRSRG